MALLRTDLRLKLQGIDDLLPIAVSQARRVFKQVTLIALVPYRDCQPLR
jgi:hypothetical protein